VGHSYSAMGHKVTDGPELGSPEVDNLLIVHVETQSTDYKVVETAFFNRERKDKKVPRILQLTHTITRVRRVQNRALLTLFQAQRKVMEENLARTRWS
jgi:hypothetical protein